jgi:hypothetical protein
MIVFARIVTRLLGVLLLALIAVCGVVAAVFCIQGHGSVSLPSLAADVHLSQLRDQIQTFLDRITAPGPVAIVSALAGLAAMALGVMLLIGAWAPTRERRIVLLREGGGVLGAFRRPLARLAAMLVIEPAVVGSARVRARARRRRDGGRLRIRVAPRDGFSNDGAVTAARTAVEELTGSLPLTARVKPRRRSHRRRG